MNILDKVKILGDAGKYDNCASSASKRKVDVKDGIGNAAKGGLCHSFINGRCVSLYKTLYTNACSFDCKYCENSSCNKRVAKFTPDELAKTFMKLYITNCVEGLFLSSGIVQNPDKTTEEMIQAVNLIRNRYNFHGYIHFKVLPGTSKELIKQASEFSDRLSINLEAPNKNRLNEVSSVKNFKTDILRRQAWIKRMKLPAGQTTQLVVGASDETDLEILKMVDWEYENFDLKRAYYSAFIPVPKTAFENKQKTMLNREHKLYSVDFMLRTYGMELKEFKQIMDDGNLPKEDPKLVLARENFSGPVDINESSYSELIRVPGIGPLSAKKIISLKKSGCKIKKYEELHNIGIVLKRAKQFISVNGCRQRMLGEFNV